MTSECTEGNQVLNLRGSLWSRLELGRRAPACTLTRETLSCGRRQSEPGDEGVDVPRGSTERKLPLSQYSTALLRTSCKRCCHGISAISWPQTSGAAVQASEGEPRRRACPLKFYGCAAFVSSGGSSRSTALARKLTATCIMSCIRRCALISDKAFVHSFLRSSQSLTGLLLFTPFQEAAH